jgi:hypothetical protein
MKLEQHRTLKVVSNSSALMSGTSSVVNQIVCLYIKPSGAMSVNTKAITHANGIR